MTLKLRLKNKANKIFRQAMRRFEPEFFYKDKRRFSPESEAAQKWRLLWLGEKLCILAALMAVFFSYWPLLPILVFTVSLSAVYRERIIDVGANPDSQEKRANDPDYDTEGPILEGCAVLVLGFICFVWFSAAIGALG